MSDTTAFGDNPFRALKSDRFPDRKKTGTASTDVVRRSYHRRHGSTASGTAAEDGVSKEDRELFLAAIRPRTSQTDDGGCFSLSEMGVMPLTDGVQKRQKRRGDRNRGHDNPSPNIHEPKSLTPGAPVGKARSATPAKAE
ncbi:MAG: hypothetical protein J5861_08035, partial [Desulfovibrio sp.]|nr:hypothetical protein [Desulfovibrio sp.]